MQDLFSLTFRLLKIVAFVIAIRAQAQDPELAPLGWNAAESAARLAALEEEMNQLRAAMTSREQWAAANCCPAPCGWFGSVDYLNWKARRDGLDFATFDPGDFDIPRGPLVSVVLPSDSGVRGSPIRQRMER